MSAINQRTIERVKRINARNKAAGHAHRIHAFKENTVSGVEGIFYIYDTVSKSYLHHRTSSVDNAVFLLTYYRTMGTSASNIQAI